MIMIMDFKPSRFEQRKNENELVLLETAAMKTGGSFLAAQLYVKFRRSAKEPLGGAKEPFGASLAELGHSK